MEQKIEHIVHSARQESLTPKERELLLSNITAFMKENPVPSLEKKQPVLSFYSLEFFVQRHSVFAAVTLILFLTGTTSAFADKAIPGDTLYPLKTGINEKVLGLFATSPESRAEWQLSLADRRLQEIQELSKSERITEDARIELEKKIDSYTELALGENPDSLLGPTAAGIAASSLAEDSSASNVATMSVAAKVAPAQVKVQAKMAPESTFDTERLKLKIAESRDSISKQKSELKNEHLFVKRKAAVVWAEKLTLQADRMRSQGEHEAADELSRKAENIISRIEPLSSEVKNGNEDGERSEGKSVSGESSESSSGTIEVEAEVPHVLPR